MERPILFSTEMVKAILAGRKTMTRRILNPQPDDAGLHNDSLYPRSIASDLKGWNGTVDETGESKEFRCRYGKPGDLLWVRESFVKWEMSTGASGYYYKANFPEGTNQKFKPSIHMPKAAARIWLLVEDIRVERLQSIRDRDALNEGIAKGEKFSVLWESIHGPGSWIVNPWVWVVKFKVVSMMGRQFVSKSNGVGIDFDSMQGTSSFNKLRADLFQ